MLRLALALFLVQSGFHGYTASLPLALAREGVAPPEVGLIIGVAPLLIVIGTLATGPLIDRLGVLRVFAGGVAAYLASATILALAGSSQGQASVWPFVVARLLQGVGYAAAAPAVLSVVPALVPVHRQGVALAVAGTAQTLTLVILPPISIAALDAAGLPAVSILVGALVLAALVLIRTVPLPARTATAARRFGTTFRRAWLAPLAIFFLYTIHWGVAVAYVPARADAVGANVGLFFAADGIAVVLLRIPSGWLADRFASARLVLAGLALTTVAIALLIQPPSTLVLVIAGVLIGSGAGLIITPLLVELGRRSDASNRGSAFALYSAAVAGAHATGSIVAAPLVALAGFEAAVLLAGIGVAAAAAVTVGDRGLWRRTVTA